MKYSKVVFLAAGAILWNLSGCSSSNNETADNRTTERVNNTKVTDIETRTPRDTAESSMPMDTTSFAAVAASSDLMEIQTSTQAQTKAKHPEVKQFASQMVMEHTKTTEQLQSLAGTKNLMLPAVPIPMHERMMVNLSKEKDADDYDKEYMDMQVLAHKQAIDLFERAAKNETDPELRAFAATTLPNLRMHLDMAQKTKNKVR